MDKPNGRLVLVSFTHYCAFTPSLSTRWSFLGPSGESHLGACFPAYMHSAVITTELRYPARALGRTMEHKRFRPSRSSRTKDSPPQISYAHSRIGTETVFATF